MSKDKIIIDADDYYNLLGIAKKLIDLLCNFSEYYEEELLSLQYELDVIKDNNK